MNAHERRAAGADPSGPSHPSDEGASTPPVPKRPLSRREQEVLSLLSLGLRNRAIAEKLYVGEETVKSHLKNIYRKLGVSNRGEAIAMALNEPSLLAPRGA